MRKLFTIGHSTHAWADFLHLLKTHCINAIADVRSSPYSARLPQYNREVLDRALPAENIRYAFLGARRTEPECYVDGVARYDLIARTAVFQAGLDRVLSGTARFRLALVCAEKDPLECHRTILVCRSLASQCEIHTFWVMENSKLTRMRKAACWLRSGSLKTTFSLPAQN